MGSDEDAVRLRPIHDRVVVRPEETTQIGMIFLPDQTVAAELPTRGQVLACGPGRLLSNGETVPMQVKAGDTVLYDKWSGSRLIVYGEDILILRERDIMLVV